jgi:cysteine desulfurase
MTCDYARMQFFSKKNKRIYLDFAAATPVHKDVFAAMKPYFTERFGNASAIHSEGREAREAIETARTSLARMLRVRPQDVIFTGNGTESNNIAIRGLIESLHRSGRPYDDMEIITTRIEHPSVLETVEEFRTRGVVVSYAHIREDGRIDEESIRNLLNEKTVLVTYAYVNSEIGVIQDVKKISRAVKKHNAEQSTTIKMHLDASQAPLWLPCQMDMLGVDLMTLDAGKCYGPKGVGVLAGVSKTTLSPLIFGGGQEGGLRSGTESTALIVGCVTALLRADKEHEERAKRVSELRNYFIEKIAKEIPDAVLNGSKEHRVANNVHISVPGYDTEFIVVSLDVDGIAASTRSACGAGATAGSYVVREIADEKNARATLRFTLGEETAKEDIDRTIASLRTHLQSMSMYTDTVTKS